MIIAQKVNFETIQGYVNAAHELQEVGDKEGCFEILEKLRDQLHKAIQTERDDKNDKQS